MANNDDGQIGSVILTANSKVHDGQSAELDITVYDNGDPSDNLYAIGTFILHSYGGGAKIKFTVNEENIVDDLREMADRLEQLFVANTRYEDN